MTSCIVYQRYNAEEFKKKAHKIRPEFKFCAAIRRKNWSTAATANSKSDRLHIKTSTQVQELPKLVITKKVTPPFPDHETVERSPEMENEEKTSGTAETIRRMTKLLSVSSD